MQGSASAETETLDSGRGRASLVRGARVGRYVVLERLGAGGMGVVYAAYDPQLDRKVAIKLLRGVELSLKEGQALARLSHPHIVKVHDVGAIEAGGYVAMELVEGVSLREWAGTPRAWRAVVRVFLEASRALAAAHQAGVIHRDFKPDNVFVRPDGRACVMDFGIARDVAPGRPTHGLAEGVEGDEVLASELATRTDAIVGTPAYMAPELFRGAAAGPSTDQFSLCVALYEVLYGERPFPSAAPTDPGRWVPRGAPPGAKVPRWLRQVVLRGLSIEPASRYATFEELIFALSRERTRRPLRIFVATLGAAATLLVGGAVTMQLAPSARCQELEPALLADFPASSAPVLRAHAAQWLAAARLTCEAALVRRVLSGPALAARQRCLAVRRAELLALAGLIADKGVRTAQDESVVGALHAADECLTLERGTGDAALAGTLEEPVGGLGPAVGLLARGRALYAIGRHAESRQVLGELVSKASPDEPLRRLIADAEQLLSQLAAVSGDREDARAHAMRALWAAESTGYAAGVVRAALGLMRWGPAPEGGRWVAYARATIESVGGHGAMEALVSTEEAAWRLTLDPP